MSGHGKKLTERRALTPWRWQREGLVRIRKETDRATRTHSLETEGETCQDMERNRPSDEHSLSRDSRGKDLSRHGKKPTERGKEKKATEKRALTSWRRQREGFVRTRKETDRMTRTHFLEMAEGGTCQDTKETDQTTRAHSLETAEEGTC